MKKFTRIFFGALIISLFVNLAYSEECTKIVVSGDPEYPPITWKDRNSEKLLGTYVELLEIAFSELNIPIEAKYVGNWTRAQSNALHGNIDILAGPYINDERKTYMDYVFPEFSLDPTVVFVWKGQTFPFKKWEDLIGLKGGIPIGNSYGDQFDEFAKGTLKIRRVSSVKQLFRMLEAGRIKYILLGLYQGLIEAEKIGFNEKIEYLPHYLVSEKMYVAFSKKSPCKKYLKFLSQKSKEFASLKTHEKLLPKYIKLWNEDWNEQFNE
jgi:polar amino acid transport system substrate-binding protein